jgi:hypothetical protein
VPGNSRHHATEVDIGREIEAAGTARMREGGFILKPHKVSDFPSVRTLAMLG